MFREMFKLSSEVLRAGVSTVILLGLLFCPACNSTGKGAKRKARIENKYAPQVSFEEKLLATKPKETDSRTDLMSSLLGLFGIGEGKFSPDGRQVAYVRYDSLYNEGTKKFDDIGE